MVLQNIKILVQYKSVCVKMFAKKYINKSWGDSVVFKEEIKPWAGQEVKKAN